MLVSLPMCNQLKPKMLDCPVNAYDSIKKCQVRILRFGTIPRAAGEPAGGERRSGGGIILIRRF